ncbi:MAG: hypothetical protein JSU65_02705 [Candidatus Zixiibacteriota bacterium]|nr:MAG: hypothetical protein JSU65_02705 [candidate division Zixibacteria bacterium]
MREFRLRVAILTVLLVLFTSFLSQATENERVFTGKQTDVLASSGDPCCEVMGDCDGDGALTPMDLSCLVNCMWRIYPPMCYPYCPDEGDVNCSGSFDPLDAVYLVNYFYRHGPGPCDCSEVP